MRWTKKRVRITRSKLVYEVAKKLNQYLVSMTVSVRTTVKSLPMWLITRIQGYPMNESTDNKWKIGEGFMRLENMFLVRLVSVSKGSFQPEIWVVDSAM